MVCFLCMVCIFVTLLKYLWKFFACVQLLKMLLSYKIHKHKCYFYKLSKEHETIYRTRRECLLWALVYLLNLDICFAIAASLFGLSFVAILLGKTGRAA